MNDLHKNDGARPTWISKHLPPEVVQSKLFIFNVKFTNDQLIKVDIANDIEIDYERLEEQMDQVPGQYVWWASVYSEAKAMATLLERRIKIRRGKLVDAALKAAHEAGTRLTDKQSEKIIESDELLQKWEVQLIMMEKNVGKLFHMVKAVDMKSELLRSRSGFKKGERESQR